MFVGVEIATNGDARIGVAVEQVLDKKTRLERLPFAFLRRKELALRDGSGSGGVRQWRWSRSAKVKIDDMKE